MVIIETSFQKYIAQDQLSPTFCMRFGYQEAQQAFCYLVLCGESTWYSCDFRNDLPCFSGQHILLLAFRYSKQSKLLCSHITPFYSLLPHHRLVIAAAVLNVALDRGGFGDGDYFLLLKPPQGLLSPTK